MKIKQLEIFDNLALLARSPLFGDSTNNRKTNPNHAILNNRIWVEFIVLPLDPVKSGQGSLTRTMEQCCSMDCRFLPKALKPAKWAGFKSNCNQARAVNNWTAQIQKLRVSVETLNIDTDKVSIETRLTSFGDMGRLNDEGINHIYNIINASEKHHAYTANWRDRRLSKLGGLVQASVGNLDEALEGYELGFMPYGLTRAENLLFRGITGEAAYACPYSEKSLKGCTSCALSCDGSRAISLHGA